MSSLRNPEHRPSATLVQPAKLLTVLTGKLRVATAEIHNAPLNPRVRYLGIRFQRITGADKNRRIATGFQ